MKLSNAIQEFDLSMSGGAKAVATRVLYDYSLKKLRDFLGDDIELGDVTISHLRRWRADLEKTGLSVYTRHRDVRQIRRFFRWCVEESLLEKSPAERLDLPKLPRGEPPKAISEVDLERMLDAARASSVRDYAIVRFLSESGCRVAGLTNLRFGDVDLGRGRAFVKEKGDKTRSVSYGEITTGTLRAWLVIRPRNKWGDKVFVGRKGPLTP